MSGVVAVVAGDGNRELFESVAAPVGPIRIVEGGQTSNPSTAELLAAIESLDADEVILLPNNSNVRLAAEQAAQNADAARRDRRDRLDHRRVSPRSSPSTARAAPPRTPPRCARRSPRSRPAK